MTILTVHEKYHHGNTINTRAHVLRSLDAQAVEGLMYNPNHGTPRSSEQIQRVLDELTRDGKAEFGWATYTLHRLPEAARCEYYALCDNRAVGVVSHPVINHPVPTCQRCADKHNLEVVKFPQAGTVPTVDIESKFTLVREANGDVKMIDPFDLAENSTPDRNLWAVENPDEECEHESIVEGCEHCAPDFALIPGPQARNGNILYYLVTEEEWTDEAKDIHYVY